MSKLLPLLIKETAMSEFDLRRILRNAPSRYKEFCIPKRDGGGRLIAQPAREVKALQRVLMDVYLDELLVHPAATAYKEGASIKKNAQVHAGVGPIRKYDFENFFPSITAKDWNAFCDANGLLDDVEDRWISEQIIFRRPKGSTVLRLSIGAPSSPLVSNAIMYDFDAALTDILMPEGVRYTRYADDLTFSAPRTGHLNAVDRNLRRVLREVRWPRLKINEKKTVLATRKYRRQVTGLILSNDGTVSIGRDRKREIRAALHRASLGRLSAKDLSHLCGLLGFAADVEPDFVARMEARYGAALMKDIKAHAEVSRRE